MRIAIIALAAVAIAGNTVAAQTRVVVEGRVVERGTGNPVANASVELDGQPIATTSTTGQFQFDRVTPGGYSMHVAGLGYAPADLFLVIRRDTTLTIELDVSPFALDTVSVDARRIDLRGHVRQRGSDLSLTRTEVLTNLDRRTRTNAAGRFRLRDLPAGVPVLVRILAFGYLSLDSTVVADKDTSMVFGLEIDPLAQRMIEVEVARLEERSRPFRTAIMPPIDREELLRNRGTVLDLVQFRYGVNLRRVRCILIDDRQTYNGLDELALILPDELERIEVLERGAMLRIYTREFIKTMLGGGVRLARPLYVPQARPPLCH